MRGKLTWGNTFRIRAHGGPYGQWWKIQARYLFFWSTLADYITRREDAESRVETMIRAGGGRWAGRTALKEASDARAK